MTGKVIPFRRPPPRRKTEDGFFLYNFDKIQPVLEEIFGSRTSDCTNPEGSIAVLRLSDGRFEAIVPGKQAYRSKSRRYLRTKLRQLGFAAVFEA